jgi:hypothetical protein
MPWFYSLYLATSPSHAHMLWIRPRTKQGPDYCFRTVVKDHYHIKGQTPMSTLISVLTKASYCVKTLLLYLWA